MKSVSASIARLLIAMRSLTVTSPGTAKLEHPCKKHVLPAKSLSGSSDLSSGLLLSGWSQWFQSLRPLESGSLISFASLEIASLY